jgi:glycosyltransferase involved in cell wall biosynthesis
VKVLAVLHTPRSPRSAVFIAYSLLGEAVARGGGVLRILTPDDFPNLRRLHARWLPFVYPFAVAARLARDREARDVIIFHSYSGWVASLGPRRGAGFVTAFHGLEPLYYRELAIEMRRLGRPLRLPFRVLHGWFVPAVIRLSCRRSDAVFCLNRDEARFLTDRRWADPSRIELLSHGVGPEFFLPRTYDGAARALLFVGQWLPMKGTRDLVEAFLVLARARPDLRLCCAGTIVDTAVVMRDFPAELRSRVDVRQRVTHAELIDLYARSDLFVFPSLSEGFSRALIEAMAAGLPIVTTPAGAASDLLDSDRDALLVPKRDVGSIARAVERLLDDEALRARLGRAAQARAREFTIERVLEREIRALEMLAGTR